MFGFAVLTKGLSFTVCLKQMSVSISLKKGFSDVMKCVIISVSCALRRHYCEYRLNSFKEAVNALKQVKVFFPHHTFKRLKHGIGADLSFFMLYLCYRRTVL